jgi:YaiO family outer membrane protein
VQTRLIAVATLLAAVALDAAAQGEPEQRAAAPRTTAGLEYSFTTFGGAMDAWQLAALSIGRSGTRGTLIGRINVADRFDTRGAQYEVDAYPTLGKGKYAYLNLGFSNATIFPEQRYGAEYFTILPHAYEASLGLRILRFSTEQVTLFTGSVGRYTGNYWFSLRPYVRRKPDGNFSATTSLTARRYYADADSYVGARIGAGSAPTETLDPSQLGRQRSVMAGLHASRPISGRTLATWMVNYERDESPIRTLNRWEFVGGVKVRF